ncbi:2210_t:CDS:2 [Funneliformis mosseae]|uniref:2210_t:CDS:1 n=1 Tax=Funneliformis mosseae TaxID=27381 RepID=A0A9N9CWC2_FUNMO|nr:2210_t:CDS:2 [Funneliformis mosseae]
MKFTPLIIAFAAIAAVTDGRFTQEHTPAAEATFRGMRAAAVGTPFGERLGDLSGLAVDNLLAGAPACGQQNVADKLIKIAIAYRKLERNTPLLGQPSNFCDKRPKNKELIGVFQAQDPTKVNKRPPPFVSKGEKLNKKPNFGKAETKEVVKREVKKETAESKRLSKAAAKCKVMLAKKNVAPGQKRKCEKILKSVK